jgi:hypothetical protein
MVIYNLPFIVDMIIWFVYVIGELIRKHTLTPIHKHPLPLIGSPDGASAFSKGLSL